MDLFLHHISSISSDLFQMGPFSDGDVRYSELGQVEPITDEAVTGSYSPEEAGRSRAWSE